MPRSPRCVGSAWRSVGAVLEHIVALSFPRTPSLASTPARSTFHLARRLANCTPPHSTRMAGTAGLVFRQLFEKESSTYTYLLADAETKEVGDSAGPPPSAGVTAQSTAVKRR
jgi:hypothetical protein